MNLKLKINLFVLLVLFFSQNISAFNTEQIYNATVKITSYSQANDIYSPWSMKTIEGGSGSGVIIKKGFILTNAHVAADAKYISIKKYNGHKEFEAEVVFIGHTCDLAILKLKEENNEFFNNAVELEFDDDIELQDEVIAVGYPAGGDRISITKGIISRIEYGIYSHDGNMALLQVQIDAAINPGNSGGPIIKKNKIVGLAFQGIDNLNNVGYFIPSVIIKHFLEDIKDKKYDGFPILGIETSLLNNESFRNYLGLDEKSETGVYVSKIYKNFPYSEILKEGDIIISINNTDIGCDGMINTKYGNLDMSYLINMNQAGDTIVLKILRNGLQKIIMLNLSNNNSSFIYNHQYEKLYPYNIIAGYVFMPLTSDYLKLYGKNWDKEIGSKLLNYYYNFNILPPKDREEIVIISRVLKDDINKYNCNWKDKVIESVNGQKINSFKAFSSAIDKALSDTSSEYICIECESMDIPIVIPKIEIKNSNTLIKNNYNIEQLRRD